jgi:tetratricopeptide (TPR) repeat protein
MTLQFFSERLHRYSLCREFAQGEYVIDLDCGDGYGAWLLSPAAKHVRCVDSFGMPEGRLQSFFKGNAALSCSRWHRGSSMPFDDKSAGLVLSLGEGGGALTEGDVLEVKRVLRSGGVFALCVQEKESASPLTIEVWGQLLRNVFTYVRGWRQQSSVASLMTTVDVGASNSATYRGYTLGATADKKQLGAGVVDLRDARTCLFLCSDEPVLSSLDAHSVFGLPQATPGLLDKTASDFPGRASIAGGHAVDGVAANALARMLGQMSRCEVSTDGDELIRALKSVARSRELDLAKITEGEAELARVRRELADRVEQLRAKEQQGQAQSDKITEQDDVIRLHKEEIRMARQAAAALARKELVIRAETDTAIAQKLAQQRRAQRLRLLAREASERLAVAAEQQREFEEELSRSTRDNARLSVSVMRALAAPAEEVLSRSLWRRVPAGFFSSGRARAEVTALVASGDLANSGREWARAAACYAAALLRDPTLAAIWVQFGHALKEMGMQAEAEVAYREAARAEPMAVDALVHLGHLMKTLGRPSAAIVAFSRVLECDPGHAEASQQLEMLRGEAAASGLDGLSRRLQAEADALS